MNDWMNEWMWLQGSMSQLEHSTRLTRRLSVGRRIPPAKLRHEGYRFTAIRICVWAGAAAVLDLIWWRMTRRRWLKTYNQHEEWASLRLTSSNQVSCFMFLFEFLPLRPMALTSLRLRVRKYVSGSVQAKVKVNKINKLTGPSCVLGSKVVVNPALGFLPEQPQFHWGTFPWFPLI